MPKTVKKDIRDIIEATKHIDEFSENKNNEIDIDAVIEELKLQMNIAAEELEFERAAEIRDKIKKLMENKNVKR